MWCRELIAGLETDSAALNDHLTRIRAQIATRTSEQATSNPGYRSVPTATVAATSSDDWLQWLDELSRETLARMSAVLTRVKSAIARHFFQQRQTSSDLLLERKILVDHVAALLVASQDAAATHSGHARAERQRMLQAIASHADNIEQSAKRVHALIKATVKDYFTTSLASDGIHTGTERAPMERAPDEHVADELPAIDASMMARWMPPATAEVALDERGQVKSGTRPGLIQQLLIGDDEFVSTFMLTHQTIVDTREMFEQLVAWHDYPAPSGLGELDLALWEREWMRPVQRRVCALLRLWLDEYFHEDVAEHDTASLLADAAAFAKRASIGHLLDAVERRQRSSAPPRYSSEYTERPHEYASSLKSARSSMSQQSSARLSLFSPFSRRSSQTVAPSATIKRRYRMAEQDPGEIARQLTILESRIFAQIEPYEVLDKAWSKPELNTRSRNVKAMILNSNMITGWAAESILQQQDIRKRLQIVKHFILIADKCRELRNFSAVMAIISGLNSAPVHRLRRTWDMLSGKYQQIFDSLNQLMSSNKNFSEYRHEIRTADGAAIPFLGVFLTDLTFLEDANHDTIKRGVRWINFSKRTKIADTIRDIRRFQSVQYILQPNAEMLLLLEESFARARNVSSLYDLSLQIEPREREDEKMARLLTESGFL